MSYSAPETAGNRHPRTAHPDASRGERVQIFALPTRTMYGPLRFSWLSYLGLAEQQHAAQLPTPAAAVSCLSTQALMRAMAAARLDVPSSAASEIEVDRSCTLCTSGKKHGKPRIAGVNFNMSQVNPLVVGAFSRNSSAVLGVDVETMDARLFSGFARLALSDEERAFYERVAQERPASALRLLSLALWTAKEAVLKATGHGLSVVPSLVRVQFSEQLLDALEATLGAETFEDPAQGPEDSGTEASENTGSNEELLKNLTGETLRASAVFRAPGDDTEDNPERTFALQWVPVALPGAESPEHAQKMLIALAVENPAHSEPTQGEPVQVEVELLPVATPLELKRLLTD